MGDAWSVIVTREPEWDDYTRAEAIADLDVDSFRCKECGVEEAFVPIPQATRHWTWVDGRKFEVQQFRCLACAAIDTIKRDLQMDSENKKPTRGVFANEDGLRLIVKPYESGPMPG